MWNPQPAFQDFFYTEPDDIIKHSTVFRKEYEYYVPFGGRGSGKTYTFADAVIIEATLRKVRILVTREIQDSIDESIKQELEKAIINRGLEDCFKITNTYIECTVTGSYFLFKGLKNNIRSVKSISNVDVVLCEEAEAVTKHSWDVFLPSIRPDSGRPIVIVIFNPANELDDTYQRFIVNEPPQTVKKLINWSDNIHFPPFLEKQRLHAKKTMPLKDYEHIWDGKPIGSSGDVIIDLDWIKAARFASRGDGFKKTGEKVVSYDPAGQGRDSNASLYKDGNIVCDYDEWVKSADLREATTRAFSHALKYKADRFVYDECGGFGDGVSVFVDDIKKETKAYIDVFPFNAGDNPLNADKIIEGTDKTNGETYSNAKAQAHGVSAQLLYNTFRFVVLGEEVDSELMISIDIEDDDVFNKLARELSTPLWVRSATNSKKKVESKKDMEKRTGMPSPNMGDAFHMLNAPQEHKEIDIYEAIRRKKAAQAARG